MLKLVYVKKNDKCKIFVSTMLF